MHTDFGALIRRALLAAMLAVIAALTVCTVTMVILASCGITFTVQTHTDAIVQELPEEIEYGNDLGIALTENGYYYEQLDPALQKQYDQVLREIVHYAATETLLQNGDYGLSVSLNGYSHTEESMDLLYHAVYNDHPELFFMGTGFAYAYRDAHARLDLTYGMGLAQRREANEALLTVIRELEQGCTATEPYETERYFHDALLTRCTYADEAAEALIGTERYVPENTPYASLCEGKALCGGYARAMQWLLLRAGIPTTVVYNDTHVWNMVWIDGEPYHLDATWDDFEDGIVSHGYFNVTDDDLLGGRTLIEQKVPFPTATATAANFHRREGAYIEEVPSEALTAAIHRQVGHCGDRVELRFAPSVYETAVAYMDEGEIFAEFDGLDDETAALWDGLSYYPNESMHIVLLTAAKP